MALVTVNGVMQHQVLDQSVIDMTTDPARKQQLIELRAYQLKENERLAMVAKQNQILQQVNAPGSIYKPLNVTELNALAISGGPLPLAKTGPVSVAISAEPAKLTGPSADSFDGGNKILWLIGAVIAVLVLGKKGKKKLF